MDSIPVIVRGDVAGDGVILGIHEVDSTDVVRQGVVCQGVITKRGRVLNSDEDSNVETGNIEVLDSDALQCSIRDFDSVRAATRYGIPGPIEYYVIAFYLNALG